MQNIKAVENMTGHLTSEERQRREEGQKRFRRANGKDVLTQLPDYLDGDDVGTQVWCQTLADAEEMEIFDDLDRETLGSFCCITSRIVDLRRKYRSAVNGHRKNSDVLDIAKEIRLLEAQQLTFASKMGLTPESRARLALQYGGDPEEEGDDLYG